MYNYHQSCIFANIMRGKNIIVMLFWSMCIAHTHAQETKTIPEVLVSGKKKEVFLYTSPHIIPDMEEIRDATETSFFDTVSDKMSQLSHAKFLYANASLTEEDENFHQHISELCLNNGADYAVLPTIKFFKVGLGKYIFSSQVAITLRVYKADGTPLFLGTFDTFKKKGRMFGSAENAIRKGTEGALRQLHKNIKKGK